jgi:hypothetical protein
MAAGGARAASCAPTASPPLSACEANVHGRPRSSSLERGHCKQLGPEERSFRKSPDSYTVLGPWLVTSDELTDPSQLGFTIAVNGEIRQEANTDDLILGVSDLVEWASSFYTLHPGDVILTGTPQGVGPVRPGDALVAKMEKIGQMQVDVASMELSVGLAGRPLNAVSSE